MKTKLHVAVPNWVDIGSWQNCNSEASFKYDKIIHIWRNDLKHADHCQLCLESKKIDDEKNLFIQYKDGHKIEDEIFHRIVDFLEPVNTTEFKRPKILIHCQAGLCRSPTLAIFVLAYLTNSNPLNFLSTINLAYDSQAQTIPNICRDPLISIRTYCKEVLGI